MLSATSLLVLVFCYGFCYQNIPAPFRLRVCLWSVISIIQVLYIQDDYCNTNIEKIILNFNSYFGRSFPGPPILRTIITNKIMRI